MTEQATTDKRTWQCDVNEVESLLDTSASRGLTDTDAAERLARFGPNQLREKKGRSPIGQFLDQFKDFMIWVLIGAALVSGFLGEWVDAVAIIAIVILNAIMGFVQEYRAEKSLAALKKLSSSSSKVIRDGDYRVVPSGDIVPGDLVELEAGDNVPADGRVVWHTSNFSVQEASLTGESTPVLKTAVPLDERE
ncbi:MAG TPA: HAD-IC family P-type ATPase, partial [Acidobacteriota bacterium]|nr:HAD-IC family P-type ATPase [Acidobacteriota bacterium]